MLKFLSDQERISFFSFFLLTFGFILYHTLVSLDIIPLFLGGWYGAVSFLTFFFIIINFKKNIINFFSYSHYSIIIFLFYFYTLAVATISLLIDSNLLPPYLHFIGITFHGAVLFYIGYYLDFNKKELRVFLNWFMCLSLFILIVYFYKTGELMLRLPTGEVLDESDTKSASYQTFGRTGFICLSILMILYNNFIKNILVFLAGIVILFFLGARSEAIAFLVFSLYFLAFSARLKVSRIIVLFIFITFISIVVFSNIDFLSNTRFGQLSDISSASSWQAREEFYEYGKKVISDNFVLGSFGSSYLKYSSVGSNPHNIISAWSNFGIMGYFLYLVCCVLPVLHSFYLVVIKGINDKKMNFTLFFGLVCILLLFTAKSIFWIVPPFYWGVYLSCFIRQGCKS